MKPPSPVSAYSSLSSCTEIPLRMNRVNSKKSRINISAVSAAVPSSMLVGSWEARQKESQGKLVNLTLEESQSLLQAAERDQSLLTHPFIMVTLYTVLRHSAALNLRARDVDVARCILWIGHDKTGRREQRMPQILASYLDELTAGMDPDAYLVASQRAKSGRAYQMNSIFVRCVERAGIAKHVRPHTMRHTAATNAAHAGLDAATIQAMGVEDKSDGRKVHSSRFDARCDGGPPRAAYSRRVTPKLQRRTRLTA